MTYEIFDARPCDLGEGPLWHPERQQLFWFDIVNSKLLTQDDGKQVDWQFDRMVSVAGWVDRDRLLIGSERNLFLFDVSTEEETHVIELEQDNPITRSNDGRVDPFGGLWIGTMGKSAESGAGAIYRFYRGEVRQVYPDISIPNAICFGPNGRTAFFADTVTQRVYRQTLDAIGWPEGPPELLCDFTREERFPDGAVVDRDGNIWIAQWGSARVACYAPDGAYVTSVSVGGKHASCPAFGRADFGTLFVTTARQGLSDDDITQRPENGMVFAVSGVATGLAEHRVRLD